MLKICCYISLLLLSTTIFVNCNSNPQQQENDVYDIVVYGGSSGGIAAAIQASRMDKSVILLEPGNRIGGLTTGGLGQTDIGNKQAIGGISLEFYRGIKQYYDNQANWKFQSMEEYQDGGQTRTDTGETAMWTFEPSAALAVYQQFMAKHGIELKTNQKLDRRQGVKMEGNKITAITTLSGETFKGRVFIDATYEGDLMAAAGVSYTVGREANETYGETLNGVHTRLTDTTMTGYPSRNQINHNLVDGVDPYVVWIPM
jgi:predicted flavoprotein YhiN